MESANEETKSTVIETPHIKYTIHLLHATIDHRDEVRAIKYVNSCLLHTTPMAECCIDIIIKYLGIVQPFTSVGQTHKPVKLGSYTSPETKYIKPMRPCTKCGKHSCTSYRDQYNWCYSAYRPFYLRKGQMFCPRCDNVVGDVFALQDIYHCANCDCKRKLEEENNELNTLSKVSDRNKLKVKRKTKRRCHEPRRVKSNSCKHRGPNSLFHRFQKQQDILSEIKEVQSDYLDF